MVIPKYVPYVIGEKYARTHTQWILEHSKSVQKRILGHRMTIGKRHVLTFVASTDTTVKSRVQNGIITIQVPSVMDYTDPHVQTIALKAATRAVKKEAEDYLPSQLYKISQHYSYNYKSVSVKNMHTRWGSCSSEGVVALNIWLMQVPEELIRYVLCHELAHLKNPHHRQVFWDELATMDPDYKLHRAELKSYHPSLT